PRPRPLRRSLMFSALIAFALACGSATDRPVPTPEEFLFAWVTDSDSTDLNFLAVVDADSMSESYGTVLRTLAIPTTGRTRGHHTEHEMSEDGFLFANDFGTGKTYVLDLRRPLEPAVADSFTAAGPLTSPHSFERLPTGTVLATFQNEGVGNAAPGGLAELGPRGEPLRWGLAVDGDRHIRPYSLAVVTELDRVVTGSADMRGQEDSHAVQVWSLGDLRLLHTIDLPAEWGPAAEPRLLEDGETVLVTTFGCKLLRMVGLEGGEARAELAYDFGGVSCALPVVVGDLWIQAVPDAHGLVALDVSDPGAPREVSRLTLTADDWPHWISLSPDQRRIVITGYAGTRHRIIMVDLDPSDGTMRVDPDFGGTEHRPGISLDRTDWPHGATGPGDPHGVVFSRGGVS
ncbi:MAG: selenium-binding family protein, partial [Gemmatimonadota bacterium]|nr:selenium-binding family protein [Gemmatimonadota bacterium]